jgi:membrane protease YdiL (CAAX protease family)
MKNVKSFLTRHPVLSVIVLTISWFMLIMLFAGIASSLLKKGFGDPIVLFIGHLAGIIFVFILLWRLECLKVSGTARSGTYQTWLFAIGGTLYFALASLYSFYGKLSFDFANLVNLSSSGGIIVSRFANCVDEEMLFRGFALYILIQNRGKSIKGKAGSVFIISLIFALFHSIGALSSGFSLALGLLLLEALIISIWWAALVLKGGSIWPAFFAHFIINALVAVQGLSNRMIQPELNAYILLLLFSIPLGLIGFWLIIRRSANIVSSKFIDPHD